MYFQALLFSHSNHLVMSGLSGLERKDGMLSTLQKVCPGYLQNKQSNLQPTFCSQIEPKYDHRSCLKKTVVLLLGYVYLVFDSEKSIKALLSSCTQDCSNGGDWYFQLSSRRIRCKEVSILQSLYLA